MVVILALFTMFSMGMQSIEKIRLQNTADAAAYSASVAEARDYNFSAYTNRAMIANQVAVAQFVGLTSWMRNMSAFANANDPANWGRDLYEVLLDFGGSPVADVYKSGLSSLGSAVGMFDEGRGGSTFMTYAVTALDGLIKVYGTSQKIYHYSTALSVAQTLGVLSTSASVLDSLIGGSMFSDAANYMSLDSGNIIHANDLNAQLTIAGLPYLAYHYSKWFKFTEAKDPNTNNADGPAADRFAQVTMDSLDDFSRDRSTKPAWGFSSMYAPPLTYIDPTRFIPFQNGPLFLPVIHRGGTELKLTDTNGAGTGTAPPAGTPGQGVDCNGNPISVSSSATSISVIRYTDLPMNSTPALCDGTQGLVTGITLNGQTVATKPEVGVYVYQQNSHSWINPATMTNTTGKPGNTTTPPANGNRGAVGSKSKLSWTALDASSWAGIDIIWFEIPIIFVPIPLPIPFAPPWLPLSHGAAQSGKGLDAPTVLAADNNFGVSAADAYGGVLDSWTTKIAANMQKDAGTSLDKAGLGGLTEYMDVTAVSGGSSASDNLEGPPLVIEIEKPIDVMAANPGSGQLATENGAPKERLTKKQTMRSLSKSQVYFSRPTDLFARTDGKTELGSLYNPYWQARLLPNNFLEQYLSMEMHLSGL